jgi:AcrR family transcriptional regulator
MNSWPPRPGRPRSRVIEGVVVDTVLESVSRGATLTSMSFVSISQDAGVSRNSVYRRWNTKERLFIDVLKSFGRAEPELTEHSARENLVMMLDRNIVANADPRVWPMERAVMAESQTFPDLFEFYEHDIVAPLINAMKLAIRRGKDAREIRVDVDENVLARMLTRVCVSDVCHEDGDVGTGSQHLVDLVFDGVSPK